MNTPIPENMIVNSFTDRYSGKTWAVVAAHQDEWVSVVEIGKEELGPQLFTFWSKSLKAKNPIEPQTLARIKKIRADLESGRMAIKDTRLVTMSQCEP